MTGQEMINWILAHSAENKQFEVQRGMYTDAELFLDEEVATNEDGRQYERVVL